MTKTILAVAASTLIATGLMAGGDIAPIAVVEAPVEDNSNFYIGGGYSYIDTKANVFGLDNAKFKGNNDGFMLQAGYNFNEYVAVEGRYTYGTNSDYDGKVFDVKIDKARDVNTESFALYVKPQYPVTEKIGVYALVGVASLKYSLDDSILDRDTDTEWGFAYGLGAKYSATDSIDVFVDATSIYDVSMGQDDIDTYAVNVGLTYNF